MTEQPNPIEALMKSLAEVAPEAPTACSGWTVHELIAHLAAGVEESTDLIEDVLSDRPNRPTREFDEREVPFRAMADDELRRQLVKETERAVAALGGLAQRGPDATFEFFNRPFTAAELQMHAGCEFAFHRWDFVGDDEVGDALLSPAEVTQHAVKVLNGLPMLAEAPGNRSERGGLRNARVILRATDEPDIAWIVDAEGAARLDLATGSDPIEGDVVVSTDAVNRALTLWGRRSSGRSVTVTGDETIRQAVETTLWPEASVWPPRNS